jgi:hypothetical protein
MENDGALLPIAWSWGCQSLSPLWGHLEGWGVDGPAPLQKEGAAAICTKWRPFSSGTSVDTHVQPIALLCAVCGQRGLFLSERQL